MLLLEVPLVSAVPVLLLSLEMGEGSLLQVSPASGSEVGRVMAGISNLKSSSPKLGAWNV